jgi:predicted SAM-dependent methyltransferase
VDNFERNEIQRQLALMVNESRLTEAKQLLSTVEDWAYSDPEMLSIISVIYTMEGNLEKAAECIRFGLEINPDNADLNFNFGYIHELQENYIEALDAYQKAKLCCREESSAQYIKTIISNIKEKLSGRHKCNICNNKFEKFIPWPLPISERLEKYNVVGSDIRNYSCPVCGSNDRIRHLYEYFNKLDLWGLFTENSVVLHIAPEYLFQRIFTESIKVNYICGDLYPNPSNKSMIKLDVTNIQFPENYFNFIMCNHVLEHVEEDTEAMKEFYRVLKPGGYAILQTPYSPEISNSYEDSSIVTKADKNEHFGQEDHVRIYGLDLFERLESVGFKLQIIRNSKIFNIEECEYFGYNFREDLILVKKDIA